MGGGGVHEVPLVRREGHELGADESQCRRKQGWDAAEGGVLGWASAVCFEVPLLPAVTDIRFPRSKEMSGSGYWWRHHQRDGHRSNALYSQVHRRGWFSEGVRALPW